MSGDQRLGSNPKAVLASLRDARLLAAQHAVDENLSLLPVMVERLGRAHTLGQSQANSSGYAYVNFIQGRYKRNVFCGELSGTARRAAWSGDCRTTPEEAALDVARRLRDFPPIGEAHHTLLAAAAIQEAKDEKLVLLLKDDNSFYDVTVKRSRGMSDDVPPRFEARLSLKGGAKRSLGKYTTKEEAAVAVARGIRKALSRGEQLGTRRGTNVLRPWE